MGSFTKTGPSLVLWSDGPQVISGVVSNLIQNDPSVLHTVTRIGAHKIRFVNPSARMRRVPRDRDKGADARRQG